MENLVKGISTVGDSIVLNKGNTNLKQFYFAFKNEMFHSAYLNFDGKNNEKYFLLNKANKPVGAVYNALNGLIVLLPQMEHKYENPKLIGVIIDCSKSFLTKHTITQPPNWLNEYKLNGEDKIAANINKIEKEIENLENKKIDKQNDMLAITKYKGLLYEQGFELEILVLESFKIIGFIAENRKQNDLEHDVVFHSAEGKGIAEVEGKDNDSIHVSKFDQLNRAVDEDFDLTGEYAQGILVGNHYRLTKPEIRKEAFSEKVKIVAKKKGFGLLTTIELFKAVKYILENTNVEDYKKACREKILSTIGEEIIF